MEFWSPRYLTDCLEILDRQSDDIVICGGATHLLRYHPDFPHDAGEKLEGVLHVGDLPSLSECKEETGKFSIGATSRFSQLERENFLAEHLNAVWEAVGQTSTPQIRNRRTAGGELAWGSFHSQFIAALLAFDAEIRVRRVARADQRAQEETFDLMNFYSGDLQRDASGVGTLCRNAQLAPRDLIIKASIPESSFRRQGQFSFARALRPKISTENPGLVVAVRGQASGGMLARAQFVVSGLWMRTLRADLPLEGVKLRPHEFFEKLYNFADRYPFEQARIAGPTGKQLSLMIFGLLKEGFSAYVGSA